METMVKLSFAFALIMMPLANANAQNENNQAMGRPTTNVEKGIEKAASIPESDSAQTVKGYEYDMGAAKPTMPYIHSDSLNLPAISITGKPMPFSINPLYWGGWNNWNLHKGLNVSIGASVFAQFGKNAYHGAGFSQNISAMYAMPLSKKLSVAVGGYLSNTAWMHDTFNDAGLSAILGYKINDRWEAYIYGQKSFVNQDFTPYMMYDINSIGDRIGAAVKYNISKNASIQVSVENTWMPKQKPIFFEQQYPMQRP